MLTDYDIKRELPLNQNAKGWSVDRWRDEFVAMANEFAADLGGYCSATFTKNHYNLRRIFAVL